MTSQNHDIPILMPKKNTDELLEYRVRQLERSYQNLDTKIDRMLTNHLPHIEGSIARVNTKMGLISALNVGALIVSLIVSHYLK